MPKSPQTHLYRLIRSLTPSEKTFIKTIYKNDVGEEPIMIRLFDELSVTTDYNEAQICKRLKIPEKRLSDIKNHLFETILDKLRYFNRVKSLRGETRLLLDYKDILTGKSIFDQVEKIDHKIEELILESEDGMEYVYYETFYDKLTSKVNKNEWSWIESNKDPEFRKIENVINKHRLKLQYFNDYITARQCLDLFFSRKSDGRLENLLSKLNNSELVDNENKAADCKALIYYYRTKAILFYLRGDINASLKYYIKLKFFYEVMPLRIKQNFESYIDVLNTIVHLSLNDQRHYKLANRILDEIHHIKPKWLPENANLKLWYAYYDLLISLRRKDVESVSSKNLSAEQILKTDLRLDPRGYISLNLLVSVCYFTAGKPKIAMKFCNSALNSEHIKQFSDLFLVAKQVSMFIHFENDNYDLLESVVLSTKRYLKEYKNPGKLEFIVIKFFESLVKKGFNDRDLKKHLSGLKQNITPLLLHSSPSSILYYFDIIGWVDRKNT